jgi:hypothetical protein
MTVSKLFCTAAVTCLLSMPSAQALTIDWSQATDDASAAELSLPAVATAPATITTPSVRDAAYDKYYAATLEHRVRVFDWQSKASRYIFWMVIILVMAGLTFSAVQFYIGLRRGVTNASHEVELSMQAVKVKSQFLGVVTLALSLAFFYLYVANVYPIVQVNPSKHEASEK